MDSNESPVVTVTSVSSSTINILFQNRCCSFVSFVCFLFLHERKEDSPEIGIATKCSSVCLTGIDQMVCYKVLSNLK